MHGSFEGLFPADDNNRALRAMDMKPGRQVYLRTGNQPLVDNDNAQLINSLHGDGNAMVPYGLSHTITLSIAN